MAQQLYSLFGHLFFPSDDPLISTLAAFATYAVGFLARPLGGIVFGHIGDKVGRKSSGDYDINRWLRDILYWLVTYIFEK